MRRRRDREEERRRRELVSLASTAALRARVATDVLAEVLMATAESMSEVLAGHEVRGTTPASSDLLNSLPSDPSAACAEMFRRLARVADTAAVRCARAAELVEAVEDE